MRRKVMTTVLLGMASLCVGADGPWEIQGAIDVALPTNNLWEDSLGVELKGIYWWGEMGSAKMGAALSLGSTQWNVNTGNMEDTRDGAGDGRTRVLKGDAHYVPLGISLVSRSALPRCENLTLNLEGGLRYMISQSGMDLIQKTYVSGVLQETVMTEFDNDDALVGRVGAALTWDVQSDQCPGLVYLAAGYQFDVQTGNGVASHPTAVDYRKDIELDGVFLQIGLAIPIQ